MQAVITYAKQQYISPPHKYILLPDKYISPSDNYISQLHRYVHIQKYSSAQTALSVRNNVTQRRWILRKGLWAEHHIINTIQLCSFWPTSQNNTYMKIPPWLAGTMQRFGQKKCCVSWVLWHLPRGCVCLCLHYDAEGAGSRSSLGVSISSKLQKFTSQKLNWFSFSGLPKICIGL